MKNCLTIRAKKFICNLHRRLIRDSHNTDHPRMYEPALIFVLNRREGAGILNANPAQKSPAAQ